MSQLFILIKRKGSKRYSGAIPAMKGVKASSLRKSLLRRINKGYSFKIVSEAQLKKYIERMRPRKVRRKR